MDYLQIYLGFLALGVLFIYALKKRRDDDLKQNEVFAKLIKGMFSKSEPITEEMLNFHYFKKDNVTPDCYIYDSECMELVAMPKEDGGYTVETEVNGFVYSVDTSTDLTDLMKFRTKLEKG